METNTNISQEKPESDTPIPEGNLSVTAGEIREITERLFHTASGISLMEWSPIADNLLGAASRIENYESLLSGVRKLVGEWKQQVVERRDDPQVRGMAICVIELDALVAAHPEVGEG